MSDAKQIASRIFTHGGLRTAQFPPIMCLFGGVGRPTSATQTSLGGVLCILAGFAPQPGKLPCRGDHVAGWTPFWCRLSTRIFARSLPTAHISTKV
jgi:hypothetical protein